MRLEKLTSSEKVFFTSRDISVLLDIKSTRTRENIITKLLEAKILTQLEKGKYFLTSAKPNDFKISQYIYSPSYVSLESALNVYGVLSQFPFEITAVTLKKPTSKFINGKTYTYSRLKKSLFTGYIKKDDYLMASAEKALFDYLYMACKSLRSESYLNEMDFSKIDKKVLLEYLQTTSKSTQKKMLTLVKRYL